MCGGGGRACPSPSPARELRWQQVLESPPPAIKDLPIQAHAYLPPLCARANGRGRDEGQRLTDHIPAAQASCLTHLPNLHFGENTWG